MQGDMLALAQDELRLVALRASGLLDPEPDEACERAIRLAAIALSPAATTLLVLDEAGEIVKAGRGSANVPVMHGWRPFHRDVWLALGTATVVTVDVGWAAAAIRSPQGDLLAALHVEGPGQREWSPEDIDALGDLAAFLENDLAGRVTLGGQAAEQLLDAAQMLALLDSVDAGVVIEGDDGRIRTVNDEFCRLFGIPAPAAVLLGVAAMDAVEHAKSLFPDPEIFLARIEALRKRGLGARRELLPLKDGRSLERNMVPVMVGDRMRGRAWVYRDVSEREQLRQRLREQTEALRAAALVDESTGLYNHRGLLTIGMEQIKLASRHGLGALLFFVDVRDLTAASGRLPDEALLRDVGELLVRAFRGSDLVARMGSEAFVVLAIGLSDPETLLTRIRLRTEEFNRARGEPARLSLGVGHLLYEAGSDVPLEHMLAKADEFLQAVRKG